MINIDLVKKLIDQMPEIKALFRTENYTMFSSYDRSTGHRNTSCIEGQTIYILPEFLKWQDQLCFELNKLEGDY